MNGSLLLQGVELMLLGMGIVFGFLILLVFTLRAMSRLAAHLDVAPPPQPVAEAPIDITDNRQLIAAIAAAVTRFRASRSA